MTSDKLQMTSEPQYVADDILQYREQLQQWFASELGADVLQAERERVAKILPNLFGYHILQLGNLEREHLIDSSRISHKLMSGLCIDAKTKDRVGLVCYNHAIPIASDSMDVVVLPHVLEFESDVHQVLRETERILICEGHVVILGFNPWSLWGLWRLFLAWREKPPWAGHYIGLTRLKDWLELLSFEVTLVERFYFRPPIHHSKIMQKLKFIEQLGRFCWPYFGSVYLLVAKKRLVSLTPIKMQWRDRRRMISAGAAEPSARITGPNSL